MKLFILAQLYCVLAIHLDPNSTKSISNSSNLVIEGLLPYNPYYLNVSGSIPGIMQEPYYWYESGVAWGALLDWSIATDNSSLDDLIRYSIEYQSGKYHNYLTVNQSMVEANDDQLVWGMIVMDAAEKNFSSPSSGGDDSYPDNWLYFGQAIFNSVAPRWDTSQCDGGLRWQIYEWNSGYDYKSMVANGGFFHLAARLARFTNNQSYVDWAERIYSWANDTNLLNAIHPDADWSEKMVRVRDGVNVKGNCSEPAPYEWTYDQGFMMSGCAYLYNHTGNPLWLDRLRGLWSRATIFFSNDTLFEGSCNPLNGRVTCNNDERCFKGIFLRSLGLVMQLVPETRDWDGMWQKVETSAVNAALSCSGGYDNHTCGLSWLKDGWDGWYGLGEQINALDAFNTLLIDNYPAPFTAADLPEIYDSTIAGIVVGNASVSNNSVFANISVVNGSLVNFTDSYNVSLSNYTDSSGLNFTNITIANLSVVNVSYVNISLSNSTICNGTDVSECVEPVYGFANAGSNSTDIGKCLDLPQIETCLNETSNMERCFNITSLETCLNVSDIEKYVNLSKLEDYLDSVARRGEEKYTTISLNE